MIAAGIAGFAYAMPLGSIPLILACAILQGGGFGIAWPFVTRIIVAVARSRREHHRLVGRADHAAHRLCGGRGAAAASSPTPAGFRDGLQPTRPRRRSRPGCSGLRAARHAGRRGGDRHRPHGRPPAAVGLDGQSRSLTMVLGIVAKPEAPVGRGRDLVSGQHRQPQPLHARLRASDARLRQAAPARHPGGENLAATTMSSTRPWRRRCSST